MHDKIRQYKKSKGVAEMEGIIVLPDERLKYITHRSDARTIKIKIASTRQEAICPYCKMESKKVHSRYVRKLQDLPIQGKKVYLLLSTKKYFCNNSDCNYKTFAEGYTFFAPKAKKTNRLQEEILRVSLSQSSLSAEKYLRESVADISKSSICNMLKKSRKNN
jgi:transposase